MARIILGFSNLSYLDLYCVCIPDLKTRNQWKYFPSYGIKDRDPVIP